MSRHTKIKLNKNYKRQQTRKESLTNRHLLIVVMDMVASCHREAKQKHKKRHTTSIARFSRQFHFFPAAAAAAAAVATPLSLC